MRCVIRQTRRYGVQAFAANVKRRGIVANDGAGIPA
jgi:hypothetical protein